MPTKSTVQLNAFGGMLLWTSKTLHLIGGQGFLGGLLISQSDMFIEKSPFR